MPQKHIINGAIKYNSYLIHCFKVQFIISIFFAEFLNQIRWHFMMMANPFIFTYERIIMYA